jgi:2-(1,2-epoxy-1,2-dihydrophenyl)acetyl-CoA isomerase
MDAAQEGRLSGDPPVVTPDLGVEFEANILHVQFRRPERRNALTRPVLEGLELLMRWAAIEPAVRSVLLSGQGGCFSAGDDRDGLGDALGAASSDLADAFEAHLRPAAAILRLRKPVIAALEGPVYGGALDIALACDLRVADPSAVLGPIYSTLGFVGGMSLLALYVGVPRARRILFLGEPIEAEEATSLGLIEFACEPGLAIDAGRDLAGRLAQGPTAAFGMIKSTLLAGSGSGIFENLYREEESILSSLRTADGREGVRSLAERRTPRFVGE